MSDVKASAIFLLLQQQIFRPAFLLSVSRSASDNIWTIIEKTESVYVQKFQRLINGTLCFGKIPKSLANKREAVGAYFASSFIDQ